MHAHDVSLVTLVVILIQQLKNTDLRKGLRNQTWNYSTLSYALTKQIKWQITDKTGLRLRFWVGERRAWLK